jgi:hypothetical protein
MADYARPTVPPLIFFSHDLQAATRSVFGTHRDARMLLLQSAANQNLYSRLNRARVRLAAQIIWSNAWIPADRTCVCDRYRTEPSPPLDRSCAREIRNSARIVVSLAQCVLHLSVEKLRRPKDYLFSTAWFTILTKYSTV